MNRVGETSISINGQKMTIIAYRSYNDIDIQFEDGTIVINKYYLSFKNGTIRNPNFSSSFRVGETSISINGQKMTIIAYRRYSDIDIQFEDGTIVTSRGYGNFKKGTIRNPNYYPHSKVGETNTSLIGQKMTIVAYRGSHDIDIKFEDGTIVKSRTYTEFKKGKIKNPNYSHRVGETNIATNGQKITIIAYRQVNDIDIRFEDGVIVYNKKYGIFKIGKVAHPTISSRYKGSLKDHKLLGLAYKLGNKNVYYYCECTKCGKKDILNPQQILNHKCEE